MIESDVDQKSFLIEEVVGRLDGVMSYQRRAFCAGGPHRDLSLPQLFVLITLHERGPHSVSSLADLLGITAPSASTLIDRMEERGLVLRDRDATDRRVVHVAISEAGDTLLDVMMGMKRDKVRRILSHMTTEELEHVTGALRGLNRVLHEQGESAGS